MAVGEPILQAPLPVAGIRLGSAATGLRKGTRDDVAVIELAEGSAAAGIFTQSTFAAPPVFVAREHLRQTAPRLLIINAGNANAATGEPGRAAAIACCEQLAETSGCATQAVVPFSTGVIGEPLNVAAVVGAGQRALANLSPDNWMAAARAIMTTDTYPKATSRRIQCADGEITITGIAKGVGMSEPHMATVLIYLTTDAQLSAPDCVNLLREHSARSFNRISVDGDTSTNDSCLFAASGQSPVDMNVLASRQQFEAAFGAVCHELAQALVCDGEGATKLLTVTVTQGANTDECLQVAYAIARSPLVKTALFASDANWGRIVMAIGHSGVQGLQQESVNVFLGDVWVVRNGARHPDYTEQRGSVEMAKDRVGLRVSLGRGSATETVWTTDFSYDYVRINAEYRT